MRFISILTSGKDFVLNYTFCKLDLDEIFRVLFIAYHHHFQSGTKLGSLQLCFVTFCIMNMPLECPKNIKGLYCIVYNTYYNQHLCTRGIQKLMQLGDFLGIS